ncbi:hypothetical protein PCASD_17427 [Puccinia coronata f. sp. avenae]|uniref:Uncharacterized protein n=1 Tax=Puccinia coronata f. sp. avenae TaxID=200324 RepID=A0A2N5TX54_9BASI|nr:hypothetical protein PCASD_17427 [Puccinia coronata f. sp. avenae]
MFSSPLSRLMSHSLKKVKPANSQRPASSFVPTTATPTDPLPKPPSTNWFTTHPALSDSLAHLDSLIHRSRQSLHRIQILKRYAAPPDFSGTGIRSKWLKWKMMMDQTQNEQQHDDHQHQLFNILWNRQLKWQQLPAMSILVQPNENRPLRMIEYNHLVGKLNELKALKKYLTMAKSLQLASTTTTELGEINELDAKIEKELLKYSVPETQASLAKRQPVERDHLGRFHGMGRKKESSARAWMIEVKIPDSLHQEPLNSTTSLPSSFELSPPNLETSLASSEPLSLNPPQQQEEQTQHRDLPLGKIVVNGRSIVEYFHTPRQRATAVRPLEITNSMGHYNIHVLVHGGGKMGQAAAASHAIAKCLTQALNEAAKTDGSAKERFARKVLLKSQLALRDPRVVERKKTGKPGAKSSYRWVKR